MTSVTIAHQHDPLASWQGYAHAWPVTPDDQIPVRQTASNPLSRIVGGESVVGAGAVINGGLRPRLVVRGSPTALLSLDVYAIVPEARQAIRRVLRLAANRVDGNRRIVWLRPAAPELHERP